MKFVETSVKQINTLVLGTARTETIAQERILEVVASGADCKIEYDINGQTTQIITSDDDIDTFLAKLEQGTALKVTVLTENGHTHNTAVEKILMIGGLLHVSDAGSDTTRIEYWKKNFLMPIVYIVEETYAAVKTALTEASLAIAAITADTIGQRSAAGLKVKNCNLFLGADTALVATGTIQGDALALSPGLSHYHVATTAAGTGVLINELADADNKGMVKTIKNAGANALKVYPSVGDFIDALAVNVAFSIPAGKTAMFIARGDGKWDSMLGA